MAVKQGQHRETLDALGIEAVCDMLISVGSYAKIGKKLKMPGTAVWKWVASDETRMDLARDALMRNADACDEEAEHILRTMKDVSRARELAQHLRWRAKARNPKVYGDKQHVDLSGDLALHSLTEEQIDARLRSMLARGDPKP